MELKVVFNCVVDILDVVPNPLHGVESSTVVCCSVGAASNATANPLHGVERTQSTPVPLDIPTNPLHGVESGYVYCKACFICFL